MLKESKMLPLPCATVQYIMLDLIAHRRNLWHMSINEIDQEYTWIIHVRGEDFEEE